MIDKINLKDNLWIQGFFDDKKCENEYLHIVESNELSIKYGSGKQIEVLYKGKTSEIPENAAKTYVRKMRFSYQTAYLSYEPYLYSPNHFPTAKESIQSACQEKFCIIYKL